MLRRRPVGEVPAAEGVALKMSRLNKRQNQSQRLHKTFIQNQVEWNEITAPLASFIVPFAAPIAVQLANKVPVPSRFHSLYSSQNGVLEDRTENPQIHQQAHDLLQVLQLCVIDNGLTRF